MHLFLLLALLLSPFSSFAGEFGLPLRCTLGKDCFIQNYVDRDPSKDWQDYACGRLSYDGHKGTDFRILDKDAIRKGVEVTAVASGEVLRLRDGAEDSGTKGDVKNKECGNGVVVGLEDGTETQYCHLRKGSIIVKRGQKVTRGDVLGMVGYSGETEFPHVHLEVRKDGKIIDPFMPESLEGCAKSANTLWRAEPGLGYQPTAILRYGFTDRPLSIDLMETNPPKISGSNPDGLIFWAQIWGLGKGDTLQARMFAPDGTLIFEKEETLPKSKAQLPYAFGKKRPASGWPAGEYRAEIEITGPAHPQPYIVKGSQRL